MNNLEGLHMDSLPLLSIGDFFPHISLPKFPFVDIYSIYDDQHINYF